MDLISFNRNFINFVPTSDQLSPQTVVNLACIKSNKQFRSLSWELIKTCCPCSNRAFQEILNALMKASVQTFIWIIKLICMTAFRKCVKVSLSKIDAQKWDNAFEEESSPFHKSVGNGSFGIRLFSNCFKLPLPLA